MANAKDRISELPNLPSGYALSGGAFVPISQFQYTTTGTLTTFKVLANTIAAVALSGISGAGFVAFSNPGYVTRTFTGGTDITVAGGTGAQNPAWNHNDSGVASGTYGSVSLLPVITVNARGHLTNVSTVSISAGGTLTDITITGTTNQVSVASTFNPSLTSGSYTLSLPTVLDFTGKTISAGTYVGATLSGGTVSAVTLAGISVLTGTISGGTLSGVTIAGTTMNAVAIGGTVSSTGSFTTVQLQTLRFADATTMTTAATIGSVAFVGTQSGLTGGPVTVSGTIGMAVAGVTAATYGSATQIPVVTFDAFGRATSATTAAIVASSSLDVAQVWVFS